MCQSAPHKCGHTTRHALKRVTFACNEINRTWLVGSGFTAHRQDPWYPNWEQLGTVGSANVVLTDDGDASTPSFTCVIVWAGESSSRSPAVPGVMFFHAHTRTHTQHTHKLHVHRQLCQINLANWLRWMDKLWFLGSCYEPVNKIFSPEQTAPNAYERIIALYAVRPLNSKDENKPLAICKALNFNNFPKHLILFEWLNQ